MASNSEFKIERNIPIHRHRHTKFPFAEMEIGDSFLLPDATSTNAATPAYKWAKANGWKFTARKLEKGVRVWRIE